MATHFLFSGKETSCKRLRFLPFELQKANRFFFAGETQEIVPFNAQYGFPSQATRALKSTVKVTPREAGPFKPGQIIRIDLPAQGYLNPLNTTLRFGVTAWATAGTQTADDGLRLAKNANCVFSRLRILYGSLVLEDIQDYNVLVRMLTNCTIGDDYAQNAGALYEGLGTEFQRARYQQRLYKSSSGYTNTNAVFFQINLLAGLLTQKKLLPLKWLASQLRIELYVAPSYQVLIRGNPAAKAFIGIKAYEDATGTGGTLDAGTDSTGVLTYALANTGALTGTTPVEKLSYEIGDVELVAELLEFDNNYDAAFYQGLMGSGVPIQFQSFHSFPFSATGTNAAYPIQERAKSIKAAFACMIPTAYMADTVAAYHYDSFAMPRASLTEYQWRVGGKYYPSQPVRTSGLAVEAFVELQKALHLLGDLDAGCQIKADQYGSFGDQTLSNDSSAADADATNTNYETAYISRGSNDATTGKHWPWLALAPPAHPMSAGGCSAFCIGTSFESTNGMEISGINGEEQNDILLRTQFTTSPAGACTLYVFTHYDAMIVVRPNNVVDLIF